MMTGSDPPFDAMMLSTFTFWILLLPAVLAKGNPPCGDMSIADVRHIFKENDIPATIHLPFRPDVLFELTFPEPDAPPILVTAGTQLTVNETTKPPCYAVCGDSHRAAGPGPFVVVGIDPDAPTPIAPTLAQVLHFLGGGFYLEPEHQGEHVLVNKTPAISEFLIPQPPAGSPPHRYIFLLFKESPGFKHQKLVNSSSSPLHFNVSAFAEATGLGKPLGGTLFFDSPNPTI